jgi:hypothetical protein
MTCTVITSDTYNEQSLQPTEHHFRPHLKGNYNANQAIRSLSINKTGVITQEKGV